MVDGSEEEKKDNFGKEHKFIFTNAKKAFTDVFQTHRTFESISKLKWVLHG